MAATEFHIVPRSTISTSISLHNDAMAVAKKYRQCEAELLEILIRVEQRQLYYQFEIKSLHEYCVELLGISSHAAMNFINVARTAKEIPELAEAIYAGKTTVSKARKICSVITPHNAKEWIEIAINCSCRIIGKAVATANPRAGVIESLKYVSSDVLNLQLAVSEEWAKLLTATKDRLSQQKQRAVSTEEALFTVMRESFERNDPVKRAERSAKHKTTDPKPNSPPSRYRPAQVRHAVANRDQGQCVHVNLNGSRCESRRWIDQHHIKPFAEGGDHTVENLETLCRAHHRMRHMN